MAEDLELKKAFFLESAEILERLDADIATLGAKPGDTEVVNSVFRGLHTIKGNSSFLEMNNITKLAHAAETLLDKARKKEMMISLPFLAIVTRVFNDLKVMIVDQQTELDVSLPITVIQKFMAGDRNAAAAFDAQPTTAPAAAAAPAAKLNTGAFVRVDEVKIAKILSVASELELARYTFEQFPERMDVLGPVAADLRFELDLQVSKLSRLVRSLSSIVFGVRLVPVKQVFQRFPRVVTELAQKLGKDIQLKIVNGDAELDKTIVEAIADPMTHLIRNSADHGIETKADRVKAGKSPVGTIKLNSYVRGNFVFIEIADDGKGINGEKILAKAVEIGIVPADKAHTFTENQKLALIFAPGFSMAEKVTDISGRGVGMDVVKSNINKLKGTVIIDSKVGVGTVIQLRFPMSMVVLFSLFLDVQGTCCAIPVDQVDESTDFGSQEVLMGVPPGDDEENYMRMYSLRSLLWGKHEQPKARAVYHTIRLKDRRGKNCVFIVEEFLSIEEAIVQSVDSYIAALPGLQGATIRKDGSVALVLNSQSIVDEALRAQPYGFVRKKKAEIVEEATLSSFLGLSSSG